MILPAIQWGRAGGWYTGGGTPHQAIPISVSAVPELNALQEELEPFGLVILGFLQLIWKQEPGETRRS